MSDDDIRQLLTQGARAPRRRVDIAKIHRRGRRRRASVIGGGVTLAVALVAAVAISLPPPSDMVVSTMPDPKAATGPQGSALPGPEADPTPQDDTTTTTAEEAPAEEAHPGPTAPEPAPTTTLDQKPGPDPEATDYGAPLWGRSFVVVAVTENGQPRPLPPDRDPWTTSFWYDPPPDPPQGWVGWHWGDCNGTSADVEVTPDRLELGGRTRGSTLIGCPDQAEAAAWEYEFFRSGPYWRLEDGRLWLWSGDTVVELEDRTDD